MCSIFREDSFSGIESSQHCPKQPPSPFFLCVPGSDVAESWHGRPRAAQRTPREGALPWQWDSHTLWCAGHRLAQAKRWASVPDTPPPDEPTNGPNWRRPRLVTPKGPFRARAGHTHVGSQLRRVARVRPPPGQFQGPCRRDLHGGPLGGPERPRGGPWGGQ